MRKFFKKYPGAYAVIPLAVFSLLLAFLSPEEILDYVGVENAYTLMFFVSLVGGLTIFSAIPYPLMLVTFALGGLDPVLLGLSSASGIILGDSTSYFLGYRGKAFLDGLRGRALTIFNWMQKLYTAQPKIVPLVIFLYGALIPLPNDIITISAGLSRYPFWSTMLPLAAGNFIFSVGLAYFAEYASVLI